MRCEVLGRCRLGPAPERQREVTGAHPSPRRKARFPEGGRPALQRAPRRVFVFAYEGLIYAEQ